MKNLLFIFCVLFALNSNEQTIIKLDTTTTAAVSNVDLPNATNISLVGTGTKLHLVVI